MEFPLLRFQLAGTSARPSGRPELAFVLRNLAIGEYPMPEDASWLRDTHGISSVVSLHDDTDLFRKGLELCTLQDAYRTAGIRLHRLPIADGDAAELRAQLDRAVELLCRLLGGGERVYLHCNAGVNRAPTVAIAYLHVHEGHALEAARDLVKACRPCVPYMRALAAHFG